MSDFMTRRINFPKKDLAGQISDVKVFFVEGGHCVFVLGEQVVLEIHQHIIWQPLIMPPDRVWLTIM
tara:strand:- start:161 stop:361 length:201 start_codon:yes stop_codon:yes gene_type:complete